MVIVRYIRRSGGGKLGGGMGGGIDPICPISKQIEADANDCQNRYCWAGEPVGWYFDKTGGGFTVGRSHPSTYYFKQGGAGLRYLNITLTPSCTVTSAKLYVRANGSEATTDVNTRIRGEKSLSPVAFTDLANYQARTRTTEYVNWDNIEAFTAGNWYYSPDFKDVIQEIIEQSGWAYGNPIVIFWDDHDDRTATGNVRGRSSFQYASGEALTPYLLISCTP